VGNSAESEEGTQGEATNGVQGFHTLPHSLGSDS
jgi:hypothetical protein